MDRCIATKRDGAPCTHPATVRDVRHYCRTHHNSKMQTDIEYRTAYNNFIQNAEQRRQAEVAAVLAQREREVQARRAARIEKNRRALEDLPNYSLMRILKFASRLMSLWNSESIAGYDCVKAYAALTYMSARHDGFINLLRAVVGILNLMSHPDHAEFRQVPQEEKSIAYAALHTALLVYGEIDYMTIIPNNDRLRELITRRIVREEAERRAAEAAAQLAEAAARRAEFEQADRERPVVFQRDPEGSIDLRAFATDPQSVHRSSVQNTTQRIIQTLLSRTVPADQETIFEITVDFQNPEKIEWRNEETKSAVIDMFTDEYFSLEAFSTRYGEVVDRVWAFIRGHAERTELVIRLAQEVSEGTGMCANGKMARLINVLQGYDETLDIAPPRELFQSAIAAVVNMPASEREARARELFAEYRIPAEEHAVWLEPLLEA